jgi:hypothetical protein
LTGNNGRNIQMNAFPQQVCESGKPNRCRA